MLDIKGHLIQQVSYLVFCFHIQHCMSPLYFHKSNDTHKTHKNERFVKIEEFTVCICYQKKICMARSNIIKTSIDTTVDSLILASLYARKFEGHLL